MMNMSQEQMMQMSKSGIDESTIEVTMKEEKREMRKLKNIKRDLLFALPWNIAPLIIFGVIIAGE